MLPFLKKFRKDIAKLENVSTDFSPPDMWYSTGCYALNRVISGSYFKAIPNGRLTAFVGPSAAGKSFVVCNIIREAQRQGSIVVVLDSENALDPKFMARTGININDDMLTYAQVVTIQDVTKVLSELFTGYEKEYGKFSKTAPKIMVVLDSLGNCLTDAENEKFDKGVQTGDQGQSAKNKKHMLRTLVSRLPRYNAAFVFTDQVYPQDVMLGDGPWAVTNGVKYSASGIGLLTKLKLKEGTEIKGIRMRMEAYKSRFVQPGTKIEVEIPFSTGLSTTAGLLSNGKDVGIWEADGIVTKEGYSYVADVEIDGVMTQVKFKDATLTDELALQILKTNPRVKELEKAFEEFESNDLFTPDVDPEIIDTNTGEILTTESIK